MKRWLMGGFFGAGLAYFLDPDRGVRRRNMARDRLGAMMRRLGMQSEKTLRYAAQKAEGEVVEHMPHKPDNPNPDRLTLLDRVESEVLRDRKVKESDVVFDSPDKGVIEVRGVLESQPEIEGLVKEVRAVPGVEKVVSYLHLPGTPAPNKEEALKASESIR